MGLPALADGFWRHGDLLGIAVSGCGRSALLLPALGEARAAIDPFSLGHDGVLRVLGGLLASLEDAEPGAGRTGRSSAPRHGRRPAATADHGRPLTDRGERRAPSSADRAPRCIVSAVTVPSSAPSGAPRPARRGAHDGQPAGGTGLVGRWSAPSRDHPGRRRPRTRTPRQLSVRVVPAGGGGVGQKDAGVRRDPPGRRPPRPGPLGRATQLHQPPDGATSRGSNRTISATAGQPGAWCVRGQDPGADRHRRGGLGDPSMLRSAPAGRGHGPARHARAQRAQAPPAVPARRSRADRSGRRRRPAARTRRPGRRRTGTPGSPLSTVRP